VRRRESHGLSVFFALGLACCAPEAPPHKSATPAKPEVAVQPHFTVRGRVQDPHGLTYRIEDRGAPLDQAEWRKQVARACATWTATGLVTLTAAKEGEDAGVTLGWRRGHHGACEPFSKDSAVAHSGPVRPGTFVHFDGGRKWVGDATHDRDGYSVYGTALHELGHVLGLGHSVAADAIMRTGVIRSAPLAPSDLFGLQSLYGGGKDAVGDLLIKAAYGKSIAALRGVAPAGISAHAVLDADGNGSDDVLVWRTDRAGNGQLTLYYFGPGATLTRTVGPFYGVIAFGAKATWLRTKAGDRVLVSTFANGRQTARRFDKYGALAPYAVDLIPTEELTAALTTGNSATGDLDGDGVTEQVQAF